MGRGSITHSLRKDFIHHIFLLNLAQFNAHDMEQKREQELEDLNFVSGNQEIEAPTSQAVQKEEDRIGRNDSCPYGSGKKYKKCCMKK